MAGASEEYRTMSVFPAESLMLCNSWSWYVLTVSAGFAAKLVGIINANINNEMRIEVNIRYPFVLVL